MAKQAFDSIVQRDAPDANRGRSFARFETRFQLVWVIGALIPIVVPIPAELGFVLIVAAVAAVRRRCPTCVGMSRVRKAPAVRLTSAADERGRRLRQRRPVAVGSARRARLR